MALTQVIGTGIGASNTVTSEGGAVTASLQQGLAKCWHRGSSDGQTLHDSLNVSTIGDANTGIQTVNLTASMGNANYEASNCVMQNSTLTTRVYNLATGSYSSGIRTTAGSLNDAEQSSSIHGDLA